MRVVFSPLLQGHRMACCAARPLAALCGSHWVGVLAGNDRPALGGAGLYHKAVPFADSRGGGAAAQLDWVTSHAADAGGAAMEATAAAATALHATMMLHVAKHTTLNGERGVRPRMARVTGLSVFCLSFLLCTAPLRLTRLCGVLGCTCRAGRG